MPDARRRRPVIDPQRGPRVSTLLALLLLIALLVPASMARASAADDQAFEDRLRAQLTELAPTAVESWNQANAARDRGDGAAAIAAYRKVTELAPSFDAGFRRLAGALTTPGQRVPEEQAAAERALAIADTPLNQVTVATALLAPPPLERDEPRAMKLLALAERDAPTDPYVVAMICNAYLMIERVDLLARCVDHWLQLEPDSAHAHFVAAMVAGEQGRLDAARDHLERAREGIPAAAYERLSGAIERAQRSADRGDGGGGSEMPALPAWAWTGLWILAAWAAGLLLLFVVGWLLSYLTLRTMARAATGAAGHGSGAERLLRAVYGAVVVATGFYFWISIPAVLVAVIGGGIAVIAAFWMIGIIPIKLLVLLVIVVGASVLAILRSIFVRGDDSDPGPALELERHPRLRALLADVAATIDTRTIDAVYLVPGVQIAVSERRRRGRTRRYLILGVATLDGMQVGWLKSILAHEYGHFRNQDTVGGTFALAARRSMMTLIVRLAQSGTAGWFNPAWWFARAYFAVFLRVSQGASRLQEVLADRWAAGAYGSATFAAAYQHVIERGIRFDDHARRVVTDVVERERPLANFYDHRAPRDAGADEVDRDIAAALDRQPSPYDSHPAPRQRMAWVAALAAPGVAAAGDDEPAWTLFSDRAALERQMTEQIRDTLERGIGRDIPAEAGPPEDSDDDDRDRHEAVRTEGVARAPAASDGDGRAPGR